MFELPEIIHLAEQLQETIVGRRVVRVEVATPCPKFLFLSPDRPAFQSALVERCIEDVTPRG
jgi:formamidopyrimidine-DNA glycosylase